MKLRVTQTRSRSVAPTAKRATLRSLGLRKIGQTVESRTAPELRGMVNTVIHLGDGPGKWSR